MTDTIIDTDIRMATFMATNNENNNYICYICLQSTGNFVRPCDNTKCSARCHRECIATQISYNNAKCGVCKQHIVKKPGEINRKKCWGMCCYNFIKVLYDLCMLTIGSIIVFLMALGKTITVPWVNCGKVSPCDDGAVGTIFFVVPFLAMFWQFRLCKCEGKCCVYHIFICESIKHRMKCKSRLTIFIMFLIANMLVFVAHGIGYPIIRFYFHKDEFFTWRTSLAGFVIYAIIIAAGLICFVIYCIYYCIEDHAMRTYGEIEYGVDVPEDVIEGETITLI